MEATSDPTGRRGGGGRRGRPGRSLVAAAAAVTVVALAAGYVVLAPQPRNGAATARPTATGVPSTSGAPSATARDTAPTVAPSPAVTPSPSRFPDIAAVDVSGAFFSTGTFFDGRFVLSGRDSDGRAGVWLGDGTAWEKVLLPTAFSGYDIRGLAQIGHRLIAYGNQGTWDPYCEGGMGSTCNSIMPVAILYSDDARSWTSLTAAQLQTFRRAELNEFAAGAQGAVVVGTRCPVHGQCAIVSWHSADGLTWDAGTVFRKNVLQGDAYAAFAAVAATPTGFVAVGNPFLDGADIGRPSALFSTDGKIWRAAKPAQTSLPRGDGRIDGVTVIAGPRCLVADVYGDLWVSRDDGKTWQTLEGPDPAENELGYPPTAVAADSSRVVAVDSLGTWQTTDLRTWTMVGEIRFDATGYPPTVIVGASGILAILPSGDTSGTPTRFLPVPEA